MSVLWALPLMWARKYSSIRLRVPLASSPPLTMIAYCGTELFSKKVMLKLGYL